MLPCYGVTKSAERRRLMKRGALRLLARVLQECNWSSAADKMDAKEDAAG